MDGQRPRGIRLTEKQRLNWLRLIRSNNVGPATFRDLITNCGSAEKAIEMLPELSRRGGSRKSIKIASIQEAEAELEMISKFDARLIGIGEPEYPSALRQIDGAPPLLTVKGNIELTQRVSVGVVGSRNASISGNKFASKVSKELGNAGYVIISGLARGIDATAHIASIETGTIAALAGGINRPYPPENLELYHRICNGDGLAITEMKFGWKPIARDFPRRNRLIAGVSMGLLVVEAAMRSGSLITARNAGDFGRLVFAVPGSPFDPRSGGTNALLKDGAILTTESNDIIQALAPLNNIQARTSNIIEETGDDNANFAPPDEDARSLIIDAMGATPVEIDDIIRHTGCAAQVVYMVLLELDLAGRLQRHPGGLVSFIFDT
ncbi:DNA-processing protein DprA [Lentilitoribacter sp. Alg239-R112]|uniref:DNA-processing protein DprA n=1 Tax=Lentilitoribacter sp. Alg239-R112 TaxID=2305987 RepID=UPI0013A6A5C4|nr:DNA-processing protein DprA [Lentilitoribacter sp. Alg239-R112]